MEILTKTDIEEIVDYYNECWLLRFQKGHNPLSLAMHMGYFDEQDLDNDAAKLKANRFLAEYAGIPSNQYINIVDLGCGVGGTCMYLAQHFPLAKITGVNISTNQLAFAAETTGQKGYDAHIRYHQADYSETGLPGASFNFVIGIESICHAVEKVKVFEEAFRLLQTGGAFVFMDYFEVRKTENREEEILLTEFRKGWAVDAYIKDHNNDLGHAGFTDITTQSVISKVLPGIDYSAQKARKLLKEASSGSAIFAAHLKACVALRKLVELGIIDYKIVYAVK